MIDVVWRVSASDFDVDVFLQEFALAPDVVWRQGEVARGRQNSTSGFNLSIDPTDTLEGRLKDLRRFLAAKRSVFLALATRGIHSFIDFGFAVGSPQHFVHTLRFPPADLVLFAELGITLEVSAYPSSDD